jgi:hypothetical protein
MSISRMAPFAALLGLGLLTAACGNNPTDRALTGGAVGAATTPEQPRYYRYY